MQQESFNLNLLFEITGVQISEYQNKNYKQITSGVLGVYEITELNMIVLKLNEWEITLNPQLPVMREQHQSFNKIIYVVPKEQGHFGIGLPNSTDKQLIDCIENVFHQHSHYVVPDQQSMAHEAMQSGILQQQPEEKSSGKPEEESKEVDVNSKKIGAFIHLGGDYIRAGLIKGAKLVSEGIKAGGQFIQTKITPAEKPTQIDSATMQKIRGARTTSKIMLTYSRQQIEALYGAVKSAGKEAGKELENTETATKIKDNKYYEDTKNVAKGALHAFAAVYDGCFEALCEIGRGMGEATVGIVDKKYGNDASQAANEGFNAVGNVGYIVKATQDVVTKDVVKETQDQQFGSIRPDMQKQ